MRVIFLHVVTYGINQSTSPCVNGFNALKSFTWLLGIDRPQPAPTPSPTLPSILLKPVAPILRDRGGFFAEKPQASKRAAPAPAPATSVPPSRGPVFTPSTALTAGGSCLQQARDCRGVLPVGLSKASPVAAVPPPSRALPPNGPGPGPANPKGAPERPAAPLAVPPTASKAPAKATAKPAPSGPASPAPTAAAPPGQGPPRPAPAPQPMSSRAPASPAGVPPTKMAAVPAPQQPPRPVAPAPAPKPSGIPTTPAGAYPVIYQVRGCGYFENLHVSGPDCWFFGWKTLSFLRWCTLIGNWQQDETRWMKGGACADLGDKQEWNKIPKPDNAGVSKRKQDGLLNGWTDACMEG